jgi:hypothetical protein
MGVRMAHEGAEGKMASQGVDGQKTTKVVERVVDVY